MLGRETKQMITSKTIADLIGPTLVAIAAGLLFGDPLATTLSRRWDVRTDARWRGRVPVGEVFAADSRPDRRAAGPYVE